MAGTGNLAAALKMPTSATEPVTEPPHVRTTTPNYQLNAMRYRIRAISDTNLVMQLMVEADDEMAARRLAEEQGLRVATVMMARRPLATLLRPAMNKAARLPLLLFSRELLALLEAGLGIVESLEALLEKETAAGGQKVMRQLLACLREGKRLSVALAMRPDVFPPLYVGIVRAAEGTSDLPRALSRFIDYRQRMDSLRGKIVSAAIYPAILLLVGGGVTLFLLGYVVPKFAQVYQGAGAELPWLSRLMLEWGRLLAAHGLQVAGVAAVVVPVAAWLLRRFLLEGGLAQLASAVPGMRERLRIYELSRLYLTLGMLLEGGIAVVPAIDTAYGTVSAATRVRLRHAGALVQSGMPLSAAFENHGLVTPVSLRMLRVGERAGQLGKMLTQSANFYEGEIGRWIDRFTRTFEPLLMVAIGLVVGTIVVLLYMPIFDLAGSLG